MFGVGPPLAPVYMPPQFKNNYFTEMYSGSEAGSYLRRMGFLYHSTLGLRVIKKRREPDTLRFPGTQHSVLVCGTGVPRS